MSGEQFFGEAGGEIPDVVEPLVGYRVFNVEDGLLTSTVVGQVYEPGEDAHAECKAITFYEDKHVAPGPNCQCGFYAFKSIEELSVWHGWDEEDQVVARVLLWGSVMPHKRGYRAEWMRIDALFLDDTSCIPRTVKWAAKSYDVDLVTEWGMDITQLSELRAEKNEERELDLMTLGGYMTQIISQLNSPAMFTKIPLSGSLYSTSSTFSTNSNPVGLILPPGAHLEDDDDG